MRLPLFLITGASGTGKSAVVPQLQRLLPQCDVFDMDIMLDERDWKISHRNWMRIAKSLAGQGRHVLLCGTTLPEHFADCEEISVFSTVHYLNLHCEDAVRDARLAARGWLEGAIDDHRQFARWLLANAETAFNPPLEIIDTGINPPAAVAELIRGWVLARIGAEGGNAMTDDLSLIAPGAEWEAEYRAFNDELRAHPATQLQVHELGDDFTACVEQLERESRGEGMPDWFVPQLTCWLVQSGRLLGEVRLRHRLTPPLENFGGHIGYVVRPSEWGKGYGTRLLALALEQARALGLPRVLIVCDDENIASARVIEKNGGVLDSWGVSPIDGKPTRRYWITL